MTLDEGLRANSGVGPGFHFMRHALAFIIIAHHCRVAVFGVHTTDYAGKGSLLAAAGASDAASWQIAFELLRPGLYALVGAFFALSGFLVTGSAIRNSCTRTFFFNRALRILPALSVEVTLSAFVLGPLVTVVALSDYFTDPMFLRYFGNIFGFVSFTLPGVFVNNPWPEVVNMNLWTLPPEFWCYFFMIGMMAAGLLARRAFLNISIVAAIVVLTICEFVRPDLFSVRADTTHFTVWYTVTMFFFGVAFCLNADRVPLNKYLFGAAAAGYYLLTLTNTLGVLSGVCLTYCVVYAGMIAFPTFDRIIKSDLSYGMYLYGFPITQAFVYLLGARLAEFGKWPAYAVILVATVVTTAVFSALSWRYIEKPALNLRKLFVPSQRKPAVAVGMQPAE